MDWRSIDIERMGLHHILSMWAEVRPETDVLIFEGSHLFNGRTERYSYRKMDALTNRFANALMALGVKKGDAVSLYLPNCPEFVIAYFGILKAGAMVVLTSPIYTKREASYLLRDTGAKVVVTATPLAANVDRTELPQLENIILIDGKDDRTSFYKILNEASDRNPGVDVDVKNDVAIIAYTSGTTGVPKGTPHTHYELTWNLREGHRHVDMEEHGVACTTTPLFHVTGYHDTFGMWVFVGAPTVVMERFDPERFLQLVEKYRITYVLIPTAGLIYLLNAPNRDKYDTSSLVGMMSGGAAVPQEIGQAITKVFNTDLVEGYGSTEALITHLNPRSKHGKIKFGSVGVALNRSSEIITKIVDEDDGVTERKQGEVGEIIVKSPSVAKGYWNKPEDTKESFRNGFWYSGDIGYIDEEGYLYITDRKKDMINVSGFKCWPREVEEVVHSHPAVADVTVVGKPDPVKGEVPVAFIAPKRGQEISAAMMADFLKDKLAKYKIPVEYVFMDSLPKTLQGKADKAALKKRLLEGD